MTTARHDTPRSRPCPIAFVGEAPGADEMAAARAGHPCQVLVGQAGRVFDQLLRVAGIDRADCWVGNVFNERLPDNKIENWCMGTKEKAPWAAEGYDLPQVARGKWLKPQYVHHLNRLHVDLKAAQPRLIVPMGATALWALTGGGSIKVERGAVSKTTYLVPGAKMLPIYHPAAILYQWAPLFHLTALDLMKAKRESKRATVRYRDRQMLVAPTMDELYDITDKLDHAELLSVDIETHRALKQITCIGFAPSPEFAVSVPFVDWERPSRSYWPSAREEAEAWRWVRRRLMSNAPKLMQYGVYDCYWLAEMGLRVRNFCEDTRLMHHALWPEMPKDLGTLGSLYASAHPWKSMRHAVKERRDD
jgi:uracil-DNA glycosylase